MKGLVKFFLTNKALSWLILILILSGGIFAYNNMGKLEDAPFTIKQALVTTSYPGASPMEVQQQVTDVLEESIQSLGELYYLKTENRAGLSKITVYVKKEIRTKDMQQRRTRQTLWRAVQMLTQKLCCQTIHDCPKVVPLHYESE